MRRICDTDAYKNFCYQEKIPSHKTILSVQFTPSICKLKLSQIWDFNKDEHMDKWLIRNNNPILVR